MVGLHEPERIEEIRTLLTDEVAYRVYVINTFNQIHERFKYSEKLLENYTEIIKTLTASIDCRLNAQDNALKDCFEQLRPTKMGVASFLDRAWNQFLDKIGWVLILVILWIVLKVILFGEVPWAKVLHHTPKPPPAIVEPRE